MPFSGLVNRLFTDSDGTSVPLPQSEPTASHAHIFRAYFLLFSAGYIYTPWLDCIGRARQLVSGRFHHSIAAAFLGTPFVLMESNTPKNQALAKIFKMAPPLSYNDAEFRSRLEERTAVALDSTPQPEELLTQLAKRAKNNFGGLSKGA